jgi:hypothetical protein
MLTHLEAYEIMLVAWVALLAIVGIQGLISVYLEDPRPGQRPSRESWGAFALIVFLSLLDLLWAVLLVKGFFDGASAGTLSAYGILLCFTLALAFIVYRRTFVPDETLIQERDEEAFR